MESRRGRGRLAGESDPSHKIGDVNLLVGHINVELGETIIDKVSGAF